MADKKISALTGASTPLAGSEVLPIVQSGATVKVSVDNLTTGKDVTVKALTATSTSDNNVTVRSTGTSNAASLILRSGNGTTSGLYSYARFINDNTAGQDWRLGIYGDSDVQLYNATGSKLLMRWGTGGDVTVGVGNILQGTAAKGINFTANTNAPGMTSELLNWYEEGTFTPTYTSTGTPPTVTYSHQYGKYTRIGRQVFFTIEIGTNSALPGTGLLAVGGLPFTAVNDRYTGTFSVGYASAFTVAAPSGGYVFANETMARLTYEASATSKTEMLTTFLTNGAGQNYLVISGSYIV